MGELKKDQKQPYEEKEGNQRSILGTQEPIGSHRLNANREGEVAHPGAFQSHGKKDRKRYKRGDQRACGEKGKSFQGWDSGSRVEETY